MKRVYQTTFGVGDDCPPEELGNCAAAVFASILEIPLETLPTVPFYKQHRVAWGRWLLDRGLRIETVPLVPEPPNPLGYAIGYAKIPGLSQENGEARRWTHAVVLFDGKIVHDPASPAAALARNDPSAYELIGYDVLVPLDPSLWLHSVSSRTVEDEIPYPEAEPIFSMDGFLSVRARANEQQHYERLYTPSANRAAARLRKDNGKGPS